LREVYIKRLGLDRLGRNLDFRRDLLTKHLNNMNVNKTTGSEKKYILLLNDTVIISVILLVLRSIQSLL
jgi:hypothetical protein